MSILSRRRRLIGLGGESGNGRWFTSGCELWWLNTVLFGEILVWDGI